MLVLNCSKAAAEFFTSTKKGQKRSPIEPARHKTIAESIDSVVSLRDVKIEGKSKQLKQWHWLVHAIKVKRKNVLIVMDYHSRFSMTLTGLKKGDEFAFLHMLDHHLNVHIKELMGSLDYDAKDINNSLENYFDRHDTCAFHQRSDGSVQAHINDVKWLFEYTVDELGEVPTDVDLIGFDVLTNRMLRKSKGKKDYFEPRYIFLQRWLNQYGELTEQQAENKIIDLKNKERAEYQAENQIAQASTESNYEHQSEQQAIGISNVVSLDIFRKNKELS